MFSVLFCFLSLSTLFQPFVSYQTSVPFFIGTMMSLCVVLLSFLSPPHFTISPLCFFSSIDLFVSPCLPFISLSLPALYCPSDLFLYLGSPLSSPPLSFSQSRLSPSISSSSRRRHDSEEGDSHRRHKHKKSKRSKEGKEASEEISANQENQEAME